MFIPNTVCELAKEGATDIYGQKAEGLKKKARCAIVKLDVQAAKTSVRADSSASRGKSDEEVSVARLLFTKDTDIDVGDYVYILGVKLRAVGVFPRYDVIGNLDHYQVDLEAWV